MPVKIICPRANPKPANLGGARWLLPSFGIALALVLAGCRQQPAPAPRPETAYAVGSTTRFIHDHSRGFDSVAGNNAGLRILIAEVWYPVDHGTAASGKYRRATYGDYVFGDRDVHRLMMTATTFFHLTPESVRNGVSASEIDAAIVELFDRERASLVDAPLAPAEAPRPVVVMSHGDAGSRYNMETACEYLAAHGYVVIAAEHAGNSPYSMTGRDPALAAEDGDPEVRARMADVMAYLDDRGVYGSAENYGQSYSPTDAVPDDPDYLTHLDDALVQRVADLRAVLADLERMNRDGDFAGRLDLERIGLMGRSFGGSTTLAALALEPRFAAGVVVVPFVLPDVRSLLPPERLRPAGQESVFLNREGPTAFGALQKPTLLLMGAEDALIIGAAAAYAALAGTSPPTAENPYPTLRTLYASSNVPAVWGMLADANHASFGVSGTYWWPALKPDLQQRFFEPETTFALVDPELAHRIQRAKVLQFFDLFVRGDAAARARLIDNPFRQDGFALEARNLEAD